MKLFNIIALIGLLILCVLLGKSLILSIDRPILYLMIFILAILLGIKDSAE